MGISQSAWPINSNGEIVTKSGIGDTVVTGFVPQDQLPVSTDGKIPLAGITSYPGGDTSLTFQIRSTYNGSLSLADGVETSIPLFTTVESGSIGLTATDQYTLLADHDGTVSGALEVHLHTTGATVEFYIWLEYSVNGGVSWVPVANSLKVSTIATSDQIVGGSLVIGRLFQGILTRCRAKRVGGTSCVITPHTLVTSNGSIDQPSALIRLYGI